MRGMDIREKFRKAAGLFVELPPEGRIEPHGRAPEPQADLGVTAEPVAAPPSRTVEQLVRDTIGPNLDEIHVAPDVAAPSINADGKSDFAAIYEHAGLPISPFTAEQMLDMLNSLPAELPLSTRRQTVKVTLQSMGKSLGATADTIVADASRKMAALAAYSDALSKQTAETVTSAQAEIAALEARIETQRQAITAAQQKQSEAARLCSAESDRLDDVLEFFSLDVPPSVHGATGPQG